MLIRPQYNVNEDQRRQLEADIAEALGTTPFGRVTWPLPNLEEITEEEYWSWHTSDSPKAYIWHEQIAIKPKGGKYGNPMWGIPLIEWYDKHSLIGGGFVVVHSHNAEDHGEKRVRYYRWGDCKHQWSERTIRSCVHEVTCAKCGAKYDYDSSG